MRRFLQIIAALGVLGVLACAVGAALFYALVLRDLPEIYTLRDYKPKLITRVLSHDGVEFANFSEERRIVVPIEEMPGFLVQAFIAAEDDAFYEHEGLDYLGIGRAMLANLQAGGIAQGGSTITQQVAKTFLLSSERTVVRKLKDMVLARRIEQSLDKNEILYLYLNQIYLGSGAYGVEAASQTYFAKPVRDLTLAQSALIAGLVPAPSKYTPRNNPDLATQRQHFVLRRMMEEGFITAEEREAALAEELLFNKPSFQQVSAATAYFAEEVRRHLENLYGSDAMLTGGLVVRTTLDIERQLDAYHVVRTGLREQDRRQGFRGPIRNVPQEEWDEVIQALLDEEVTPPEQGLDLVRGLVVEVDDANERVTLALGPEHKTYLALEDLKWAREPNPELDGAIPRVRKVSQALKTGYLVWLEKTGERPHDPNQDAVLLEGEEAQPIPVFGLYQQPQVEGALLAMDVDTGYVRAMVGGYSFERSQFNRAVQSRRQPGSAFKPIIYAAAINHGYTPATIVYDTPIVYEDQESGLTWKPGNYSDKFYGPITLRSALAHSRNIATIKILRDIGLPPVFETAQALGIQASLEANLSLALGSSEVTLAEIVRAYSTFAAGGKKVTPVYIIEVLDRNGQVLEENTPLLQSDEIPDEEADGDNTLDRLLAEIRATVDRGDDPDALLEGYVMDEVTSYLITDLLRAVVKEGTGWRAKALRRPVAGKTGTTNDLHDAWFIGFSPQVVAGVWVGHDVARNLGKNETGSRAACPLFVDYMKTALEDLPPDDFHVPEGVVFARIDKKTGLLALPGHKEAVFQPFREGTVPDQMAPNGDSSSPIRPTRLD